MIQNLNKKACELILNQNYIGHLGYVYGKSPFVIPITYYFTDNKIICYSGEGHKIHAMRSNTTVALEVSEIESIDKWQSVLVHGTYQELEGSEAKAMLHEFSLGVKDVIMTQERRDLNFISEFSAKLNTDDVPIVFAITIDDMTGKVRRANP